MPCHDRAWSSSRAAFTYPIHMVWCCCCVAVAGFSFHTLRTCIYFALKGNHRKQRMVCSFHAVVVFCMPVIKSSAGTTRAATAAAAAWSKKRESAAEREPKQEQYRSKSCCLWAVVAGRSKRLHTQHEGLGRAEGDCVVLERVAIGLKSSYVNGTRISFH